MRLTRSKDPYQFFADDGYPFDLELVERRDGVDSQLRMVMGVVEPTSNKVLDAGCGYGRITGPLHRAGLQIVGIDIVEAAVTRAKKRYPGVPFICADQANLPFADSTFDCAISLYSSIGYSRERLPLELSELRRVCRHGGLLVLDLENGMRRGRMVGAERLPEGFGLWLKRRTRGQTVQHNISISKSAVGLFRLSYPFLTRNGVSDILVRAGWKPRDFFGDYKCNPLSNESHRMIVTCLAS